MLSLLFLCFIIVPLIEVYVLVSVGSLLGPEITVLILFGTGVLGAWLARREGTRALKRVQDTLNRGQLPGKEIVSGLLVLVGGVLLLTPGFITDILGFSCLFPLTREPMRALLMGVLKRNMTMNFTFGPGPNSPFGPGRSPFGGGPTIDVDGWTEGEDPEVIDVDRQLP